VIILAMSDQPQKHTENFGEILCVSVAKNEIEPTPRFDVVLPNDT
jgi:hypothetical protein